jgi:HK97 family phage major capsid protein
MPATSMLDIVKANFSRRRDIQGELRQIDEATVTNADTNELRAYTEAEEAKIGELRTELQTVDDRIVAQLELEVREQQITSGVESMLGSLLDRRTGEVVGPDTRSIGQRFADNDEYRSWIQRGGHGQHTVDLAGLEYRAVTDTTTGPTSGGALTRPQRLDRVGQDFLDRRVFFLDMLPSIPVTNGTIEYVQDTSPLADMANRPTPTSEGGTAPQGGVTFQIIQEPTATIPVFAQITRQAAADVPQVQGYLDGRMRYGLHRVSDAQAISGDGIGENLLGLINRSGIVTYAPGSAEARYKSIRHAIRLGEDAEAIYEMIVLNPADAELFDLSNEATAGLHAMDADGGMVNRGPRSAWGLTQVRSTAITAGTAMLVDPMHAALFDRQQPMAYMTDSHGGNFTVSILTLMLQVRLGLGLFDPAGVCRLTFNGSA